MGWFTNLRIRWSLRDCNRAELVEINCLLTKAGQRCAYDLRHACADIWRLTPKTNEAGDKIAYNEIWAQRSHMWLEIFDINGGGKNYRHDLHIEIQRLESQVANYQKFLKEQGIEDPFDKVPF